MHVTQATLLTLLLATGIFGEPQARAVVEFSSRNMGLDPCARSTLGEGLFDVAGELRRDFHREEWPAQFAGIPGCIAPERQVAFLVRHWRDRPCRARFDAGDLSAFRRCWGLGRQR